MVPAAKRKTYKWHAKRLFKLAQIIVAKFNTDDGFVLSAALSYFALFSIPALMATVVGLASMFFNEAEIHRALDEFLNYSFGQQLASQVSSMAAEVEFKKAGLFAEIIGLGMLVFSSTVAFSTVQKQLNRLFKAPERKVNFLRVVWARVSSFSLVIFLALLLSSTMVANTVIFWLGSYLEHLFGNLVVLGIKYSEIVLHLLVLWALFYFVFRYLSDVRIKPSIAIWGAIFALAIFLPGNYLVGLYLSSSDVTNAYGAASSLVLLVLWVNYSALMFYFASEFVAVLHLFGTEHKYSLRKFIPKIKNKEKQL